MIVVRFIKKILRAIWLAKKFYKCGGCTYANIAYPQYGQILRDKRICVTGGSSGIGLAIAKKFAQCGAKVLLIGRNEDRLKAAISEVGNGALYISWDVCDIQRCPEVLTQIEKKLGGCLDLLVNNAGVAPSKFWGDVDEDEWNRIYNINLKGMFFLTQNLVENWKKTASVGYRKILNISSQGGFVGATYPYRMAKWDVRGFTEGLGKTLISDGIIVNGIAPGVVKTSMQKFALTQGDNLYTDQNPAQRICLPEEIAELALYLASDASNFIVGQTIVCDGGFTLK